jgi:hypothetical protein
MLFTHVVDERYGSVEGALQVTEVTQECRDFTRVVLVTTMQSDQRIKQQQTGFEPEERRTEPILVLSRIQAEGRCGYDDQVEAVEIETAVAAEPFETSTDVGKRILGEIDQRCAFGIDRKVVQGWRA